MVEIRRIGNNLLSKLQKNTVTTDMTIAINKPAKEAIVGNLKKGLLLLKEFLKSKLAVSRVNLSSLYA
jgi:hypothetical protein